jgi:acyl-coenzyme A thioesterase PaaI-like protein
MEFAQRIPGTQTAACEWQFDLAEELNGGFGGTNGGMLAAVCLFVARSAAPDRVPTGIDARFIRGFRPGVARVVASVLNEGRTLTTVSVDLFTSAGKLATHATVLFVAPQALADLDQAGVREKPQDLTAYADGKQWRQPRGSQTIPLIDTFSPRLMGVTENGTATGTQVIWDAAETIAEAACIAADISVGPPVARALKGLPLAMPNPDLTLRFVSANVDADHLLSMCRLEGVTAGLASTSLEVWCGDTLVAVGISSTTCLKS